MKILLLAGDNCLTDIVYNQLSKKVCINKVIITAGVKRTTFIKRRIKKLGMLRVLGQILFSVFVVRRLKGSSKKRIKDIIKQYGGSVSQEYRDSEKCVFTGSVNSKETIEILKKEEADVIIVQGTAIISEEVLNCCNSVFINMHTGITPEYRGVHGAYWALVNKDNDNCGVTVHLVDKGIDTGGVLYQKAIQITPEDNFVTYPYIQVLEGVNLELKAIEDVMTDNLKVITKENAKSKLWTHPTIFEYYRNGVK